MTRFVVVINEREVGVSVISVTRRRIRIRIRARCRSEKVLEHAIADGAQMRYVCMKQSTDIQRFRGG